MSDIASLGLAVDSSQVTTATSALDKLTAAAKPAADAAARIEQASGKASVAQKAWQQAISGVNGQLIAMSAGSGPVGTFLAALGPWGFAASVGLGALSKAISYVSESSAEMGRRAIDVRLFSEATGLTVAQISALKRAGGEFGVSGDTMQNALERLTFGLEAAHTGAGTLYDDIQKIDPALAKQLQAATSTAEGIDTLAKAYRQADNDSQRAALGRAAFGRNFAGPSAALGQVADRGGLVALADATKRLNEGSDEQIKKWATMQAQIQQMEGQAKGILASIFTQEGLEAAHLAATYMRDAALAAKDLANQKGGLSFFQGLNIAYLNSTSTNRSKQLKEYTDSLKDQHDPDHLGSLGLPGAAPGLPTDASIKAEQAATSYDKVAKSLKQMQDNAAAASSEQSKFVAFLGSGASIADKYSARMAEINSTFLENKTGAANPMEADRAKHIAESAAALDALSQKQSLRNGLLGNLASVQAIVAQKQTEINKANNQGAEINDRQTAAIKRQTEYQTEATRLQKQNKFGIFDPGREAANARLELQTLFDDKTTAGADQYAAALAVISKRFRDAGEAAQVARSPFEQLTRYQLDAVNTTKQFDQFSTSAFGNIENEFASFATGSKTASAAFSSFATSMESDLIKLTMRMFILAPLAQSLSGIAGGLFGTPGNFGGSPATNPNLVPIGSHHTGYSPGDSIRLTHMVNPAVFDHAPRYHTGIGPGERPAIIRNDESVLTPGQMRAMGGGSKIQVNSVVHNHAPVNVEQRTGSDGVSIETIISPIEDALAARAGSGRGGLARTFTPRTSVLRG